MSFMIALIGGCGVGKTVLLNQFVKTGLKSYDLGKSINDFIMLSDHEGRLNDQLMYLKKEYHLIEDKTQSSFVLEDIELYQYLYKCLCSWSENNHLSESVVIEIPSIIALDKIFKGAMCVFDHVITIDCYKELQTEYLVQAHKLSEHKAISIVGMGLGREEYLNYATDVFLNTVKLDHLSWVVAKLLHSYEAIDAVDHH